MKTYIRRQQHKKIKLQDIKQKEPLKKYRLGTISNKVTGGLKPVLQVPNLTLSFCSGHKTRSQDQDDHHAHIY